MTHADRRERACELTALGRGRNGEPLAQPTAARIDAKLPARLRIDEVQETDIR
jgi:hypothetical protein